MQPRSSNKPPSHTIATDWRIFFIVLVSAVPTISLLAYIIVTDNLSLGLSFLLLAVCCSWVLIVASNVREKLIHHVRTMSNLIEAIRAEDYSLKSSRAREPGELAELYQQINALNTKLKGARQSETELQNLLETVVNQINVAIVACDSDGYITLANRLACKLLNKKADFLINVALNDTALAEIPFEKFSKDKDSQLLEHRFPGADGRWQIHQSYYRHQGKPGRILFITDLKQVLSEEEITAWQRLIRVIGHEVNNSLTPITSICQTLEKLLSLPQEQRNEEDIRGGLSVIAERAKGLKEFISVYARIARLPEPQKIVLQTSDLIKKLQRFFSDQAVIFSEVPHNIKLFGDPVHLEQVLINLVKNAVEASQNTESPVEVDIRIKDHRCEFVIKDCGVGISNVANLFVPFYTTKAQGAGIGLTLCRQIAAKHNGQVSLENREDSKGAIAKLILPLPTSDK
jgi:nitrogen fixation/metabolism regulation signal transduction histidine kinase